MRASRCLLFTLLCLTATGARGQARRQVSHLVREAYDAGKYAEALSLAEAALDGNPSRDEALRLHEYAAVAAVVMEEPRIADEHFKALLKADAGYRLDPFVTPPSAIAMFERIRMELPQAPAPERPVPAAPAPAPVVQPPPAPIAPTRRFTVSVGIQQLVPFNRIVVEDSAGNGFRNKTPFGPNVVVALSLTPQWQLFGEGSYSYMRTHPYDSQLERTEFLDYESVNVLVGVRAVMDLEWLRLWSGLSLGSIRMFLSPHQYEAVLSGISAQALGAELQGGVDLPLFDRAGVLLRVGLRAQLGTETIGDFPPPFSFSVARNGFLWGVQDSVEVYFRF